MAKTITKLAADLHALREGLSDQQAPLFFLFTKVTTSANVSTASFCEFALGNGTTEVAINGFYSFWNVIIDNCHSSDMKKSKEKRADPSLSIEYTAEADLIVGDVVAQPPAWLTTFLSTNDAAASSGEVANAEVSKHEIMLRDSKIVGDAALNDTNALAFVIREIHLAFNALRQDALNIFNAEEHPCRTKAFLEIAAPRKSDAAAAKFANGIKYYGAYEEGYWPSEDKHGKQVEYRRHSKPKISTYIKWERETESPSTPRKPLVFKSDIGNPAALARTCYYWDAKAPAGFQMPKIYNFGEDKVVPVIKKRFNESTLEDFIPPHSVIRGLICFDCTLSAGGWSIKSHIHKLHIHRAPFNNGTSSMSGSLDFDADDAIVEEIGAMSLTPASFGNAEVVPGAVVDQ